MNKADENKEELRIRRMLKELPLEELPVDFTDQIMERIQQEAKVVGSFRYTPLISRRSALYVAFLFALFIILTWWSSIELPLLNDLLLEQLPISFDFMPSISDKFFTGTKIYALIVLIIGFGLQFYHVKRWHNRQFATN